MAMLNNQRVRTPPAYHRKHPALLITSRGLGCAIRRVQQQWGHRMSRWNKSGGSNGVSMLSIHFQGNNMDKYGENTIHILRPFIWNDLIIWYFSHNKWYKWAYDQCPLLGTVEPYGCRLPSDFSGCKSSWRWDAGPDGRPDGITTWSMSF